MPGNDEALELRRRARRRLIGAIALVLALVLIPPWVMDLEPKPVVTNLTVDIPKQQPGGPKLPAAPQAAAKAADAAGSPSRAPAGKQEVPRPPDVKPDSGLPGERPKAAAAAPKPQAIARAAPPEAAPKEAEAKRAEAILNAAETFVVPLGAFANKDNVKQLEARLDKAGVKYFTESVKAAGGEQTRVRAGPFPTKDAAEATRERLKTLGLSPGAVVAAQ
jgi:DedD protein